MEDNVSTLEECIPEYQYDIRHLTELFGEDRIQQLREQGRKHVTERSEEVARLAAEDTYVVTTEEILVRLLVADQSLTPEERRVVVYETVGIFAAVEQYEDLENATL